SLTLSNSAQSILLPTRTDSLGKFSFDNLIFYGKTKLRLTAMDAKGEKKGEIVLDSNYALMDIPKLPSDTIGNYAIKHLKTRDKTDQEEQLKVAGQMLDQVVVNAKKNIL